MVYFNEIIFKLIVFANRPNTTTSKNWNNAQPPTLPMKMWSEIIQYPMTPKGQKHQDFHLSVSMLPIELWLPNSSSVSPLQVATKEQSSKWFGACCLQHTKHRLYILYRNDLPFGLWIWQRHIHPVSWVLGTQLNGILFQATTKIFQAALSSYPVIKFQPKKKNTNK